MFVFICDFFYCTIEDANNIVNQSIYLIFVHNYGYDNIIWFIFTCINKNIQNVHH